MVFYNFKHDAERLQKAFLKLKLRVSVYKDSRDKDKWNNGELDILLAHPASVAYRVKYARGWKPSSLVWIKLEFRTI